MITLSFQFDPSATYDVVAERPGLSGPSRLINSQLYLSRNGVLDTIRALGEVRVHTLYLTGTDIPIGHIHGDQLVLVRTGAVFTLVLYQE